MRVILWQNIMCHLQAAWIRELAAKEGVSVTLVVDRTMSRDRGALGWTVPGFGRTNIVRRGRTRYMCCAVIGMCRFWRSRGGSC
jgi:hypothetical protein